MHPRIDLLKNERNSMNRKVVIHVFIYIGMQMSETTLWGGGGFGQENVFFLVHFELFSR